jgi:hypothetical protein
MRTGNIIKFQILQQTAGGCPTFTIYPPSIANLTVGSVTTINLGATGGTAPYTFSIVSGTLPTGLSLNGSTGVISGTPTTAQNISFVIKATDAEGCTGNKTFGFDVICPTIVVSPSSIADLTAGQATTINLSSNGGTAPYTYTVTSGSLPTGLTLNGGTGIISGTPTTSGAASFQITSTDANSCTGVQSYSFNVNYEADAQAFITAAGITDTTQKNAINTLVVDLKGYSIWSKMKAIYPFVGGTASTHKWNLKDPLDTDAAFRLVFAGGVTHSSNGFLPNGTNGVANTHLSPSLLTNNNTHISVYSRTDSNGIFCDIGVSAPASTYIPLIGIYPRDANNFASRMYNYNAGSTLLTANTDSRGLFISNRTSSTVLNQWKNGIKQGTATYTNTNNVTTITQNIHLGAMNLNGTLSQYSNRQQAFASIGDGLTDTEASNLYTLVQNYQTALSRQV